MSLMYAQEGWKPSRSAAEMRSELAKERFETREQTRDEHDSRTGPAVAKKAVPARRFFVTPWGLGLAAFVIMFLALFLINPPIIQEPQAMPYDLPKPNLRKVATFSAVVAGLVFLSPYLARYMA